TESDAIGYCVASLGYASVMADYLGYGDGTGVHPYLHANSEALIARDMMRASKKALAQLKVELGEKVFVAGYSQGGHAAMALVRFLESDPSAEFKVTAAAPMAGPYALAETFNEVLRQPVPHSAAEAAYLLVGLNPIYSFYNNISEFIRPELAPLVEPLFDGMHTWTVVLKALDMPVQDLFLASALEEATNPASKLARALAANEEYRWTPKAAMHLYHGHADHEVPYANSEAAYNYMLHQGANVELINLGETVDHHSGFPLAIGQAALWFETLR
ncbi:MAG: alpha/beta fold hydrolase, partial [Bdellovibrionota bacterium]